MSFEDFADKQFRRKGQDYDRKVRSLEAKVKRLKAALREIAKLSWNGNDKNDFCHPEGCESPGIARAALEGK